MNISRWSSALACAAGLLLGLSGCGNPPRPHWKEHYVEKVDEVLITEDRRQVVFLGTAFHYVFDADPVLAEVLGRSVQRELKARFGSFVVEHDRSITGSVRLWLDERAHPDDVREVVGLGFSIPATRVAVPRESAVHQAKLSGRRYDAKGFVHKASLTELNRSYRVHLIDRGGYLDSALHSASTLRWMATPVTFAAEGSLKLGKQTLKTLVLPKVFETVCPVC
jgi:hypothetical protein